MNTPSKWTGTVTLWSDKEDFNGPTDYAFECTASFYGERSAWVVDHLKPIAVKNIPDNPGVEITVTLIAPARGQRNNGSGSMTLRARFSFDFNQFLLAPSTLAISLDSDTEAGPPPPERVKGKAYLASTGEVVLAGIGTFSEGPLDGVRCAMRIKGTLDPRP